MKKRLIPFRWMPGSWGLRGKFYDEAEALYYLDGEALDRRLIDIKIDDPEAKRRAHLDIDLKYGRIDAHEHDMKLLGKTPSKIEVAEVNLRHGLIDQYEFDKTVAMQTEDEQQRQIALLEVEAKHGNKTAQEVEKEIATIRGEPWVGMIESKYDAEYGAEGFRIKLDWNDHWISLLRRSGYEGFSDDDIIKQWFADVSREAEEEEMKVIPFNSGRVVSRDDFPKQ